MSCPYNATWSCWQGQKLWLSSEPECTNHCLHRFYWCLMFSHEQMAEACNPKKRTWDAQICRCIKDMKMPNMLWYSWFLALLIAATHGHTHRSASSGVFRTVLWPRHQRPNRVKTLLSNPARFMLSVRKLRRQDFFCLNECTHTHICVDRLVSCVFPCARLCVFHRQAVCPPSCLPNYEVFVYPQNDDDRCFTFIFTHDTYSTIQSDMYNIWQSSICKNIWEKNF